jgi:S-adenosylmethionine decarboxylase proenzyme
MGHHVLLNIYDADKSTLSDMAVFEPFASRLLLASNAQVLSQTGHQFDGGFTLLYLLTTSHFSIHTWPEYSSAAIDIFTCGAVETDRIVTELIAYFRCGRHSVSDVLR